MSILDRIDATLDGLCPCGASPRPGSPYCGPDCEPTHIAADTDRRTSGALATPMRWRPDLVTATNDTDLTPIDTVRSGYTGRHNAAVYQRASDPSVWHLRLDDGHRYVGCDITSMNTTVGIIDVEQTARIVDAWQRLDRELGNTRHLVNDDTALRDLRVDFYGSRWRPVTRPTRILRLCRQCGQHGTPRDGKRPVFSPPSGFPSLDRFDNDIRVEDCQRCRHCQAPFPGPPLYVLLERDHWTSTLRIRLKADGYEPVETCIDPCSVDDLTRAVQDAVDQLETRLLRQRDNYAARYRAIIEAHALNQLTPRNILRNLNVT